MLPIRTALVSVFHKEGLDEVLALLAERGVTLMSTGGTQAYIEGLGLSVVKVEDVTGWPALLGGRVKTLHPRVMGGILGRREVEQDCVEMAAHDIPAIDLVVVDLYPFEETVASGADEAAVVEKIDIGGVAMVRAAAKNYHDVAVIACRNDYARLAGWLRRQGACTTMAQRRELAARAFALTAEYDRCIGAYFQE